MSIGPNLKNGLMILYWKRDDLKRRKSREDLEEEKNPWAICTDSVGREDKEKYEKCVKSVKKQNQD